MTHISSHIDNDDPRHYYFVRNSRLPVGTFPRGKRSPDKWVVWSCIALVVLLVAATGAV